MKIAIAAVLAALLTSSARAEVKRSWFMDYVKNVRNTISSSAVGGERKKGRGAAVAAVRGKKQKNMADPNEPTLKGDRGSAKAKAESKLDAELDVSVLLIEKGELDKALSGLEAFKAAHPKHQEEMVNKLIEGTKGAMAEKTASPAEGETAEADSKQ